MRKILLIILLVLAMIGLGIWLNSNRIAEGTIRYALERQNVPVKNFRVVSLSQTHAVLADVELGNNGELKAKQADLTIGWNGRQAERFDLVLKEADLTAQMIGSAWVIGGLERLWDGVAPTGGTVIDIHLKGDLTVHYEMGGALKATTEKMNVLLSQEGKPLLLPLNLQATAEGNLAEKIQIGGKAASENNEVEVAFDGSYEAKTKSARFEWKTESITLAPDKLTLATLSPAYAEELPTYPMRTSLAGIYVLKDGNWKLTPTVTFQELALESILAGILGEQAKVSGIVTGGIPLTITADGWRINPASLKNKGGVHIALTQGGNVSDMLGSHPQSDLVMKALANFEVDTMTLDANSTDDEGGIHLNWHFLGRNPELLGGKKIDFTLAVDANLEDIWLSTTNPEKLAKKAKATEGESR